MKPGDFAITTNDKFISKRMANCWSKEDLHKFVIIREKKTTQTDYISYSFITDIDYTYSSPKVGFVHIKSPPIKKNLLKLIGVSIC